MISTASYALPGFRYNIVTLDNTCRISNCDRIRRDIFCNDSSGCNNTVFPDCNTGGYDRIGADPAFVFNHNWSSSNRLQMNGNMNICVHMIEAAHENILSENHMIHNCNRTNKHISNSNTRSLTKLNGPHSIVNCSKIFDGRILADRKRLKWKYVHSCTSAYNRSFSTPVYKRIHKPLNPFAGTSLVLGYQTPVHKALQTRIGFYGMYQTHVAGFGSERSNLIRNANITGVQSVAPMIKIEKR